MLRFEQVDSQYKNKSLKQVLKEQEKQLVISDDDQEDIVELSSGEEWKIDDVNPEEITLKITSSKYKDDESDPEFDVKNQN